MLQPAKLQQKSRIFVFWIDHPDPTAPVVDGQVEQDGDGNSVLAAPRQEFEGVVGLDERLRDDPIVRPLDEDFVAVAHDHQKDRGHGFDFGRGALKSAWAVHRPQRFSIYGSTSSSISSHVSISG